MQATDLQGLNERLATVRDDIIAFAQDLIRTPAQSGDEANMAQRVAARMRDLDFDEVWTDEAGNVIGRVRGAQTGRTVLLATHLDTAAPGDLTAWERAPYGGDIHDEWLHGLGASSNKAAIAVQV